MICLEDILDTLLNSSSWLTCSDLPCIFSVIKCRTAEYSHACCLPLERTVPSLVVSPVTG